MHSQRMRTIEAVCRALQVIKVKTEQAYEVKLKRQLSG
jgi:hypothetical protein